MLCLVTAESMEGGWRRVSAGRGGPEREFESMSYFSSNYILDSTTLQFAYESQIDCANGYIL